MERKHKNTKGIIESRLKCIKLLLIPFITVLCIKVDSFAQVPEKVYRYCYVVKTKGWYQEQERLWRNEIMNNPQNEDA